MDHYDRFQVQIKCKIFNYISYDQKLKYTLELVYYSNAMVPRELCKTK